MPREGHSRNKDSGWARINKLEISALVFLAVIFGCATPAFSESAWNLWLADTGKARQIPGEGGVKVDIAEAGNRPWSIMLCRGHVPIQKGRVYEVVFSAAAAPPMRIETAFAMSKEPDYRYSGARFFSLDAIMKEYSYTFTMRQESDPEGQFAFYLGGVGTGSMCVGTIHMRCLGDAPKDAIPSGFPPPEKPALSRGIQFGLQFAAPYEGAFGPEFREEYLDLIKKDGRFDSVRLPVWWEYHTLKEAPYSIDPEFLGRVDWAVSNSLKRGFFTILNMHWFRALEQNPEKNKAEYLAVWKQIAERFKGYPDDLYFDILNEPNGNLDAYWGDYAVECYDLIRQTNPTRTIIISGPFWANMDRIPKLSLPDRVTKDPKVMIQFHPYVPGDFCFQATPGNGFEDRHSIQWKGTRAEAKAITDPMDAMLAWSRKNNGVRLFAGEFCAQAAPPAARGSSREDRLRWVRFVRQECEKRGIPWNYYDFCEEGSKVYDVATGAWDEDLMAALFDAPGE
jgi:endoglucanase